MTSQNENVLPWYRQFWFWFVFGPLIFIIVMCIIFVSIAFNYSDDVVTDNYYKTGVMINQKLEQDHRAEELGLSANVKFDLVTGEVNISLKGNQAFPPHLVLFLDNPAKSARDQNVVLKHISGGEYRGELTSPVEHSWYLALIPDSDPTKRKETEWILSGDINLAKTSATLLQPRTK